jgi:carboxypeptidase family protein
MLSPSNLLLFRFSVGQLIKLSATVAVSMLSTATVAMAQFDSGQISGFVRESSKAIVANATVTVTNQGNGDRRQTTTNADGYFVFPNLVVGDYTIAAEAAGFRRFVEKNVKLSAASKISVDVELQVGAVTEIMEVTASTSQVQAETAQVGRTVDSRQIQDLTLNGRNPIYLALLKPGVTGGAIGAFDPDSVSNGGFSINGGRSDEYVVMVDGAVATRTRSSGSMLGAQDVDTVQEVQILTANYGAEYGRSSGGQIRFVTKSGTRNFHGDLVENFRNSALDANTWTRNKSNDPRISTSPAAFRFNQFGFDVGGPIFIPGKFNKDRNKLFFFVAEEWIYRRQEDTATGTVPTLAMRNGDFGELLNASNQFLGRSAVVRDPDNCTIPGVLTSCQPFPQNIIPKGRISPNGQALLNAYPLPTPGFKQGSANWIGTEARFSNTRKDTLKIDYIPTEKHHLTFRVTHIPWDFSSPFEGNLDRFNALWSRPNSTGALSLISTLSPTFINEFTFSGNSDGKGTIDADPSCGARCNRSSYGINFPFLFPGTKLFPEKIPNTSITGFSGFDLSPYPGSWAGFVYSWANNTTKIIKTHTVKFGIVVERSGQNDFIQHTTASAPATYNQNGSIRFLDSGNPRTTGVAIANVLLGNFNDYTELGAKGYVPWVATATDLYLQDSWKARRNLTVEAGVRWSYWPPWHSRWGNIAMFDPDFYDPTKAAVVDRASGFIVSGDALNGIVLPGNGVPNAEGNRIPELHNDAFNRLYHDLPEGFSKTHNNAFQPRLGLAYAPNQKTAIRAGVGMFLNRTMINRDTALGGNAPFEPQQTVINGLVDAPGGAAKRDFPFTITMQDLDFKIPTAWNWNVTVERELPWSTKVEVGYVGRRGLHNQRKRNLNQLLTGTCPNGVCPLIDPANTSLGRFNVNALRPFRGIGIIGLSENSGSSRYNGMQVSLERRSATGLHFGVAYTLSKSTDNSSSLTDTLPNAYDDRAYYGISDLDRTHVLIVNAIYELPFLRGGSRLVNRLLGNWELSGIYQYQSGGPFSVRTGDDFAGVGAGSGSQFWDLAGTPGTERTDFTDTATWFNPCVKLANGQMRGCASGQDPVWLAPTAGTFGVQPRNSLRNPGAWYFDVGLRKNFTITEKTKLQFRVEAFDVLNHPNWGGANGNPTSASFGLITGKTGDARQIQVALKFIF